MNTDRTTNFTHKTHFLSFLSTLLYQPKFFSVETVVKANKESIYSDYLLFLSSETRQTTNRTCKTTA